MFKVVIQFDFVELLLKFDQRDYFFYNYCYRVLFSYISLDVKGKYDFFFTKLHPFSCIPEYK